MFITVMTLSLLIMSRTLVLDAPAAHALHDLVHRYGHLVHLQSLVHREPRPEETLFIVSRVEHAYDDLPASYWLDAPVLICYHLR